MTATALLDTLKVRGVTVRADGDVLKIKPFSALTDSDRAAIKTHKAELLKMIEATSRDEKVRPESGVLSEPLRHTFADERYDPQAARAHALRDETMSEAQRHFCLRCADEAQSTPESCNTCPDPSPFSQSPDKTNAATDRAPP